ncbi:hypothetical protein Dimus_033757 [Dionaea muscipula]
MGYMGHRRFIDENHKFRRNKSSFNGKVELRPTPVMLSGSELLDQMKEVNSHPWPFEPSTLLYRCKKDLSSLAFPSSDTSKYSPPNPVCKQSPDSSTSRGAQHNLVAKKAVSRARDDDDEGIREGQGNTIVNGVAASNKGGAQDNLVAKKAVSRARDDDDDEGIREGQGNTIVNGVAASNKGNVTWICFFVS